MNTVTSLQNKTKNLHVYLFVSDKTSSHADNLIICYTYPPKKSLLLYDKHLGQMAASHGFHVYPQSKITQISCNPLLLKL